MQTKGEKLSQSLDCNLEALKERFSGCFDIIFKPVEVDNARILFVMADGMCDNMLVTEQIVKPILTADHLPKKADICLGHIASGIVSGIDQSRAYTLDAVTENILSGLVAIFVDGVDCCLLVGVQGYPKRNVEMSQSEVDERTSHEAFCEHFKDNVALLRRRMRTSKLKTELITVGSTSRTRLCICYLEGRAKPETVRAVKQKIQSSRLDTVFCTGYISELLDSKRFTFFSAVGSTEKPDTACAKMSEGRIVIIVDGTPFAIIVPYLFSENFQTMDDYNFRPFYAGMTRIIKSLALLISVFLPSVYIAVCTFHQEMLPISILYDVAVQESITPFSVMLETIFIHFVYEIVREAGVRMPKAVGNAVSIVGGLVIGQAAVDAGLIAAPMLIIMALSAISSFTVPTLYQPVAFLRFLFMIVGGVFGFYGIVTGFLAVLINSCWASPFGVPLTAPVSPFSLKAMRDTFVRVSWRRLAKKRFSIKELER